jgi:ornithine decarboxylase
LFSEFLPINLKKNWLNPSSMDGIYYAMKCNSMPNVVDTLRSVGCRFEVNNYSELLSAKNMDVPSNEMINSSPITSSENLRLMKNEGINYFCVDSKDQIDNLSINAPGSKIYVRLIINNNHADLDLNSRLGVEGSEIPDLLNYAESKGLISFGLTFHVGSQCTDKRSWGYGIRKAAEIFNSVSSLKMLNIGGGLPVRYQTILSHNIQEIVKHIWALIIVSATGLEA